MPTEINRAVGLFENHADAEAALSKLHESGFNMDKVSVINKRSDADEIETAVEGTHQSNQTKSAAKTGAKIGGAGGGAVGLVAGLGILAIPGVGPIAEIGTLLANIVLGGAIGAAGGGLVGALVGWGLPEDRAKYYDERIQSGNYLILVEGDAATVQAAQSIIRNYNVRDWETFAPPQANPTNAPVHTEANRINPPTGRMRI